MEKQIEELLSKAKEDPEFRSKLKDDPKKTLEKELNIEIPDDLEITIVENNPHHIYLVIPSQEEMSDSKLEAIAGGLGKPEYKRGPNEHPGHPPYRTPPRRP